MMALVSLFFSPHCLPPLFIFSNPFSTSPRCRVDFCPEGNFCPTPLVQRPCPPNHYCPRGSFAPVPCWGPYVALVRLLDCWRWRNIPQPTLLPPAIKNSGLLQRQRKVSVSERTARHCSRSVLLFRGLSPDRHNACDELLQETSKAVTSAALD